MKVKVWRSGSKLGIYIPSKVAKSLGISAGDELYIIATEDAIILSKSQQAVLSYAFPPSFSAEEIAGLFRAIADRIEWLALRFEDLKQRMVETSIRFARRMRVVEVEEWRELPESAGTPTERGWLGYGDEMTHRELLSQLKQKIQEKVREKGLTRTEGSTSDSG